MIDPERYASMLQVNRMVYLGLLLRMGVRKVRMFPTAAVWPLTNYPTAK